VPAYAIAASGLFSDAVAIVLGIAVAVSGALYFADRRMKSDDNHFRGFPGLWNIAAFYLFLLHWPPAASSLSVAALIILTFMPFHVVHPVRVRRLRRLTLSLIGIATVLAMVALICDFEPGTMITAALCAIGVYVVGCDTAIRLVRSLNT
jgi:phosphatidylcholine synthase